MTPEKMFREHDKQGPNSKTDNGVKNPTIPTKITLIKITYFGAQKLLIQINCNDPIMLIHKLYLHISRNAMVHPI